MSAHIQTVTDVAFEEKVLQSATSVLVDFWAEWCGPCKMIGPILEAVAPSYEGRLQIFKLNVDENTQTPTHYNVRGIPTLILFKEGKPVATKVGALNKTQLAEFLDAHI